MKKQGISRRTFLAGTAALAAGCGREKEGSRVQGSGLPKRVILLGFDGVEPTIVDQMLEAGELPNLARLRDQGGYQRMGSSNPPQSPTAWSSFATCTWPGNHGIFDFLKRDPETYAPGLGFGTTKHAVIGPSGEVTKKAEFVSFRKGTNFWTVANEQGARCKLLELPYAYPAEPLQNGCMICGLDVPDIRGTQSTSFVISESIEALENVGGGVRLPLSFDGDTAVVNVPGFRHPRRRQYIKAPMTVVADRAARKVTITVQDTTVTLGENEASDWLAWRFEVTPKFAVEAVSRVFVLEAGEQVRLYMTCLQCHPRNPYLPISYPNEYAAQLADRYGLYKTIGWAYDTKGLERDDLTEDLFLEDVRNTMAWRERLMLDELERGRFDLLLAGWTGTDRVGHMFWRFRDPAHPVYTEEGAEKYGRALEETYLKMDEIVGKAIAKLAEGDLFLVMSDHGFHSSRYAFSINTWLVRNGYLALKGQTDSATAFTDERFLQDFDWRRTKAYGFGFGSVYLNLQGREGQGTVSPDEATGLLAEIREKLLEVTNPDTGEKVFREVYTDIYEGASKQSAPDIQLGFADGFQNAKASSAGGVPKEMHAPNDKKWSGDHAASDTAFTPGILFSNVPLAENAAIIDLGATALAHLGIEAPSSFEGRALV